MSAETSVDDVNAAADARSWADASAAPVPGQGLVPVPVPVSVSVSMRGQALVPVPVSVSVPGRTPVPVLVLMSSPVSALLERAEQAAVRPRGGRSASCRGGGSCGGGGLCLVDSVGVGSVGVGVVVGACDRACAGRRGEHAAD